MSEIVSEYSFAAWRKCVADALLKLGRPAKAKEIYNSLAEAGTCPWSGNTPWASLGSRLYLDIRDNQKATPFVKVSDGLFYLKEGITSTTPTLVLTSLSIPSLKTSEPEKPSMTFFESALHVLRNYANKQPMHYSKITELALEHNLLATEGKTPQASMGAMLVTDIRRRESRGETPVFESKGRGYYGLNEWHESPLEREIDKHNDSVKAELLKRIRSIGGREFEELVSLVFKSMGFEEVETTRYVKDEGVDVRAYSLKIKQIPRCLIKSLIKSAN